MNWKKSLVIALSAITVMAAVAGCSSDKAADDNGQKKIGVIQLVEHPALDAANKGFVEALASKGYKDGDKIKIDQQNAQADQSNLNSISQRFVSDKKDLVLAIATPAAQSMANATKDIPVVGTAITNYEIAKLVQSDAHPGANVTGTSDATPAEQQLDLILKLVPNLRTMGVIYSSSEVNSQIQVDEMKKLAAAKGITVVESTVSNVNDIQQAAQNLVNQNVQAVYTPTDNVLASAMANLASITDNAKIPVFPADEGMAKTGGVASYSVDYYKLGYQAGLMAAKILAGEAKPADMAIEHQKDFKLYINDERAQKLGITIPEELRKQVK
ncbi:ABC transporter substrate-binding protein [Veillonella sp. YH-vei2232]|jgi:putative ABC transport system substrate-binding protein|uniref:ABC transporter substrate-binding protein n=1 Tax=Veillonella absiana TaxID=3079305 RepID=A0ABU3Z8Y3_9FIRM|nr:MULTISPECIES: ABC transporter substrate-binding protein [unclassified Veillonella]NCB95016.1 ABC transporter substrate-binding protein [Negativicutes bacterium]MBP8617073.1 ABC transporter substrate-binding protein [Veillonella sp.]MBP9551356.1 ABC transporter substrate-binding protein [Veillonella sp.]MDV5062760.1 ABC transporter substrate-binding protein [Veillonella sp. YH-vei2232]MDV5088369.1 ABC transporter substrate-binding protein [Veillonella sp. YH-vei2233]